MYVFIKLHITTQSGPVILVILCRRIDPPEGGSMIYIYIYIYILFIYFFIYFLMHVCMYV